MPALHVSCEEKKQQPPLEHSEEYQSESGKGVQGKDEETSDETMDGASEQRLEVE